MLHTVLEMQSVKMHLAFVLVQKQKQKLKHVI